MTRLGAAIGLGVLLAVAACSDNPPGLYVSLTADQTFDHIELFFGGRFQSPSCSGDLEVHEPPPPTETASWTNTDATGADHVYRRQTDATDSFAVSPHGPPYTAVIRIPSATDPSSSQDTLGLALLAVATANGSPVAVGELDGFDVPTDHAEVAEIALADAGSDALELWGPAQTQVCARYSRSGTTTFVVTEWDHDCDGVLDQPCVDGTLPIVTADCDPLAYCGTTAGGTPTAGCTAGTLGACLFSDSQAFSGCVLGRCTNTPNSQVQTCPRPPATDSEQNFCLNVSECGCVNSTTCLAARCDRSVLACAAVDGAPDFTCTVPVDPMSNTVCPGEVATVMSALGPCAIIVSAPVMENAPSGVTLTTTADPGCGIEVTATTRGSDQGDLPATRVLVGPADPAGTQTALIELDPDNTTPCASATAPTCTPTGTISPSTCVVGQ